MYQGCLSLKPLVQAAPILKSGEHNVQLCSFSLLECLMIDMRFPYITGKEKKNLYLHYLKKCLESELPQTS